MKKVIGICGILSAIYFTYKMIMGINERSNDGVGDVVYILGMTNNQVDVIGSSVFILILIVCSCLLIKNIK